MTFDDYIAIDWSGARSPIYTPSIAVAHIAKESDSVSHWSNKISKKNQNHWSRSDIASRIISIAHRNKEQNRQTLIGIDFNFSYASSVAEKHLGAENSLFTAHHLWQFINTSCVANDTQNAPLEENFNAHQYLKTQDIQKDFWQSGKKPNDLQMPQRLTEILCGAQGYGHPESPFKLIGAKQVGKGGLCGMRMLHYLKVILGDDCGVWPFDPCALLEKAPIVLTEIYPRLFLKQSAETKNNQKIRDAKGLQHCLRVFDAYYEAENNTAEINDHLTDALIAAAGLRYFTKKNKHYIESLAFLEEEYTLKLQQEGWIYGVALPK